MTFKPNLSQTTEDSSIPIANPYKRVILAKDKSLNLAQDGVFFYVWHYTVASASLISTAPAKDIYIDTGKGLTTMDY